MVKKKNHWLSWHCRFNTAWCNEIGSLTSLMHVTQVHPVTFGVFLSTKRSTPGHTHTHTRSSNQMENEIAGLTKLLEVLRVSVLVCRLYVGVFGSITVLDESQSGKNQITPDTNVQSVINSCSVFRRGELSFDFDLLENGLSSLRDEEQILILSTIYRNTSLSKTSGSASTKNKFSTAWRRWKGWTPRKWRTSTRKFRRVPMTTKSSPSPRSNCASSTSKPWQRRWSGIVGAKHRCKWLGNEYATFSSWHFHPKMWIINCRSILHLHVSSRYNVLISLQLLFMIYRSCFFHLSFGPAQKLLCRSFLNTIFFRSSFDCPFKGRAIQCAHSSQITPNCHLAPVVLWIELGSKPKINGFRWMLDIAWCSEVGSLTSLDAPESHASSDVREPISL